MHSGKWSVPSLVYKIAFIKYDETCKGQHFLENFKNVAYSFEFSIHPSIYLQTYLTIIIYN